MKKSCLKCKIIKHLTEFYKNKCRTSGLADYCKKCSERYLIKWRVKNIGKSRKSARKSMKKYRKNNPEKCKITNKITYRKWIEKDNNREKTRQYARNSYEKNRGKYRDRKNKWLKEYMKNNLNFRLSSLIRTRIWIALKGKKKPASAIRDMGCSVKELIVHFESKFVEGMSWDNYGRGVDKWTIDHIKPLSRFDLSNKKQFLEAVHYTNLQPLWFLDNLRKSNKVICGPNI